MTAIAIVALVLGPIMLSALAARSGSGAIVSSVTRRSLLVGSLGALGLLVAVGLDDDGGRVSELGGGWFTLAIDRVSALLVLTIMLVGAVVSTFSSRAMDQNPSAVRHQVLLSVLVGGSIFVAVPGGPVPLVLGWLASAWALDQMVSGWIDSPSARAAHRHARIAAIVGSAALLAAVAVGIIASGADAMRGAPLALEELNDASLAGVDADLLFGILVIIAGATRSVIVPFHRWLVATLYAPTPVSAIVHAGYVSGAGLLLLRFAPVISPLTALIVIVGAAAIATVAIGSLASMARADTKGSLAWSTVAQMGFMVLQCAVGAFSGAIMHIVGHGMYKAALFLGAGDTVSSGLRHRRRPAIEPTMSTSAQWASAAAVATASVALGLWIGPSSLSDAELILLAGAAWLAIAAFVRGVYTARVFEPGAATVIAAASGLAAGTAYFAGLRVAKSFLAPSIPEHGVDEQWATILAIAALAVVVTLGAAAFIPALGLRAALRTTVDRYTAVRPALRRLEHPAVGHPAPAPRPSVADAELDTRQRAAMRIQFDEAIKLVAPIWPLSSFVAVNPLGGLESLDFDRAAEAAQQLRGNAHRSLAEYRADHVSGITTNDDLTRAIADVAAEASVQPGIATTTRTISAVDVIVADLLDGPEMPVAVEPRTELERRFGVTASEASGADELIASWVTDYLAAPTIPLGDSSAGFWPFAQPLMQRHASRLLSPVARNFVESLATDPLDAMAAALAALAIAPENRPNEIAGLLAALPGYVGLARWRNEWAQPDEPLARLRPIEIAAALASLHAALVIDASSNASALDAGLHIDLTDTAHVAGIIEQRIDAVVAHHGLANEPATRSSIGEILTAVGETQRRAIWQRAQELRFDATLLGALDGADPVEFAARPAAQLVFCIDVRSEILRRSIETSGIDETIGFAGFFGIPMSVRELGWEHSEARCPVLVTPSALVEEHPLDDTHHTDELAPARRRSALVAAHKSIKQLPGAQFATAEASGWITGPLAGWKTLHPPRRPLTQDEPATTVAFTNDTDPTTLLASAEAVLRTMSLTERFGRLVVLCGHTSDTVNNPHATALECGACAGASGAANARAVAGLLNRSDIREGLVERGITIPSDTWFLGAIHETTSDSVTLLDTAAAPVTHTADIQELMARLAAAGAACAAERAPHLPGPADRVRDRGRDWAQVRPEWGLARNGAFIIAPRSITADLDLSGRSFLHSYDATLDPEGAVLEAIMTAPLIVGHWISSQYYFSATDPDTFGAGDKLLHNPIGTIGVLSGASGDLRIGLPLQSTHVDGRRHHQPLRLLAVVQADLAVVGRIVARNPVLGRLVTGGWLRLAARSQPNEPWSTMTPDGAWQPMSHQPSPTPALENHEQHVR